MRYEIEGGLLTNIADAIRGKTGKSALITPEDMAGEIDSISGGGGKIIITYHNFDNSQILMIEQIAPGGSGTYTMYDWAIEIGGEAVTNVLIGVTESMDVYATDATDRFMPYPEYVVYAADTVLSTNSGERTPMKKVYDGIAAVFIAKNMAGTSDGGNWAGVVMISNTENGAFITGGDNTYTPTMITVESKNYYFSVSLTNPSYGGANDVTNPLGLRFMNNAQIIQSPRYLYPTVSMMQVLLGMCGVIEPHFTLG